MITPSVIVNGWRSEEQCVQ
uniref:Uncharacterized protein n=1 Tax=Anopheles minimus TaxID=112268 RepID=A0A182WNS0_9DIPT